MLYNDRPEFRHLPLPRWNEPFARRKLSNPGQRREGSPSRSDHASRLRERIDEIVADIQDISRPEGVDPKLVFRIPLVRGAGLDNVIEQLERSGLHIVETNFELDEHHHNRTVVIAFKDSLELDGFRQGIARYEAGPQLKANGQMAKSTTWDFLEYFDLEAFSGWRRRDRIGSRLKEAIGASGEEIEHEQIYIVEVEFWSRGSGVTEQGMGDVEAAFEDSVECRVLDKIFYEDISRTLVRVNGSALNHILELEVVSKVNLRVQPHIDAYEICSEAITDFNVGPPPEPDGPILCVMDTGIATGHPLLHHHIVSSRSFVPGLGPDDVFGHGTLVAGLAVYHDVFDCYKARNFQSPVRLINAKVLDDQGHFNEDVLIENQLGQVIEAYTAPGFNCRIFNLSFNMLPDLDSEKSVGPIAAMLDKLSRIHNVIFVISAGNTHQFEAVDSQSSFAIRTSYPRYLLNPICRITDPGTSKLGLTVGSIAEFVNPDQQTFNMGLTFLPLAQRDQPSPFSRTGQDLPKNWKPDLVHYGGNIAIIGMQGTHTISANRLEKGVSVLSFSNNPTQNLFGFNYGTSLAAPRVAYQAAYLWNYLERQYGLTPSANLIKALLVSAADVPATATTISPDGTTLRSYYGAGFVDFNRLLLSSRRSVTLYVDDTIDLDSFSIYEIPVPESFSRAPGRKRMTISLSFDPPTRRTRADYLGVTMEFYVYRGHTPEQILEHLRKLTTEENRMVKARTYTPPKQSELTDLDLEPSVNERKGSTLQKASITYTQRIPEDFGDTWYLAVKCSKKNWESSTMPQTFAATIVLEADDEDLYMDIEQRLQIAARVAQTRVQL